jgi:hypothetical protein
MGRAPTKTWQALGFGSLLALCAAGYFTWERGRAELPHRESLALRAGKSQEDMSTIADLQARLIALESRLDSERAAAKREFATLAPPTRTDERPAAEAVQSSGSESRQISIPQVEFDSGARDMQERELVAEITLPMDRTLRAEAIDRSWAQHVATSVDKLLEEDGGSLIDASCGSTLCRLEIAADTDGISQRLLHHISRLEGFGDSEGFYHRSMRGDGAPITIIYLSRDGHALPRN